MVKCWQLDKSIKLPKEVNKLGKCLEFDKCRLRFDAIWDDRDSPFGDVHNLVVYYHLTDDTVQIKEIPTSGKPTLFYNRGKLTKRTEDVLNLQKRSNPPLIGYLTMSSIRIRDKSGGADSRIDFYTDKDLKIGGTINVFGRKVVLTDCDQFTRNYYRTVYGIDEFDQHPDNMKSINMAAETAKKIDLCDSFKTSDSNLRSMELKERQQNMKKFLAHDNCKLRFMATMENDPDQQFIITYYLENDTISVYEIGGRNFSSSGEFLKRAKFYLPRKNVYPSSPEPYTAQMLYIGARIELNRLIFHITDADEFTLNFMESHECEYPFANIDLIMAKIKTAIEPIYDTFLDKYVKSKVVNDKDSKEDNFKLDHYTTAMALRELLGKNITEHEITTFLRYFDSEKCNSLERAKENARLRIQSMVHVTLSNQFWDEFSKLKWYFYSAGQMYPNGFMPPEKVMTFMKVTKVPLKGILVNQMFSVLKKDHHGNIDVDDFLNFIDRNKCKPPPIRTLLPADPYTDNDKKSFNYSVRPKEVDWSAFISKLRFTRK